MPKRGLAVLLVAVLPSFASAQFAPGDVTTFPQAMNSFGFWSDLRAIPTAAADERHYAVGHRAIDGRRGSFGAVVAAPPGERFVNRLTLTYRGAATTAASFQLGQAMALGAIACVGLSPANTADLGRWLQTEFANAEEGTPMEFDRTYGLVTVVVRLETLEGETLDVRITVANSGVPTEATSRCTLDPAPSSAGPARASRPPAEP